ncbi:MAG: alpha/beta fold hydrolase, partial [Halobaculum sp.]
VLAHGFFDTGRCWAPLAAEFRDDYTVVTYDARGHGRSEAPGHGYGIDDRVADLVGVLDALDVDDPMLLGHSMGGSTVAATAARYPDQPRGIILEDPAGMHGAPETGPDERATMVRERIESHAEQSVAEIAAEYDDRDPKLARRLAVA